MARPGARRSGFALRELVAVAFILLMLLCVLLPWLAGRRAESREELCLARLKEVGFAVQAYHEIEGGKLPGFRNRSSGADVGWVEPLFPYLRGEPQPQGPSKRVALPRPRTNDARLPEVLCPDLPAETLAATPNRLSIVVNCGLPDAPRPQPGRPRDWRANGCFFNRGPDVGEPDPPQSFSWIEQRDGADFTLLLSENVDAGLWTDREEPQVGFVWVAGFVGGEPNPGDLLHRINAGRGQEAGGYRAARPSSYHPGGVNVLYASGRGQFLDERVDYLAYCQVMSADGANVQAAGRDEPLEPPYRAASTAPPPAADVERTGAR